MTISFKITADRTDIRLDQFLAESLTDISRSKIKYLIKNSFITVNGNQSKPGYSLKGNESIICEYEKESETKLSGEPMDLNVLYEDKYIAVIDKPSGLVVHPGSGNHSGTLVNGLISYFNELSSLDSTRPGIVHRLDKGTSGVIIVAKTDNSHHKVSEQFSKRTVKKEYRALVWGKIDKKGNITGQIGRHPANRKAFSIVQRGGRDSETVFERIDYFEPISLVRLLPKTGRTHQLRVHMKEIGHPIVGDDVYSGGKSQIKSYHERYIQLLRRVFSELNRFALHAYSIEVAHPENGKNMKWIAPLPNDLVNTIEVLKLGF